MAVSPSRAKAFEILLRVAQQRSYASDLLHSELCSHLDLKDRALTTEIVMGVLRWQSVIDAAIAEASSLSLAKLDAEVLIALRLATFQFLWLDRVPPHAAIYESVELVKRARKRSAVPFANAVLRKLTRSPNVSEPKRTARVRDAEMLAKFSAHPDWLVRRWYSKYGADVAQQICDYDQTVPITTIRLRDSSAEDALRDEGISLAPGNFLATARKVLSGNITQTKAFVQERIVIQDEASQLVAAMVGSGARILDCCAAPGGKTMAIADQNPAATVVAVELHAHRARRLKERVTAPNVKIINADISKLAFDAPFDHVLVDAPCSGTGTLARNPEIKWRLQQDDLADLHLRQVAILNAAMDKLAPGGQLVYATCSLEAEEGEGVVEEVLRENRDFRIVNIAQRLIQLRDSGELLFEEKGSLITGPFLRTIPGMQQCDGFFGAILERIP